MRCELENLESAAIRPLYVGSCPRQIAGLVARTRSELTRAEFAGPGRRCRRALAAVGSTSAKLAGLVRWLVQRGRLLPDVTTQELARLTQQLASSATILRRTGRCR